MKKLPLGIQTFKSEYIVAPILAELFDLSNKKIGLYSGKKFDVDIKAGLRGVCDFIITRTFQPFVIKDPIKEIGSILGTLNNIIKEELTF